jgi:hypothetical protein
MLGHLRQKLAWCGQYGNGDCGDRPANKTGANHHGSPSSWILRIVSNANPSGGIKTSDNAAFGVEPQGYGKQTGW